MHNSINILGAALFIPGHGAEIAGKIHDYEIIYELYKKYNKFEAKYQQLILEKQIASKKLD